MRQRLTIILTIVVIVGVLALVSSLSYVKKEKLPDYEMAPNRSTYHSGPTGVRALHDFLNESGYRVIRWKDTPQKLLTDSGKLVKTFVVVGQVQVRFTEAEHKALSRWVAAGGHLVLIDRNPDQDHDTAAPGSWSITTRRGEFPSFDVNPADANQMTDQVVPFKPVQPTLLTRNVQSVQPSRFASRLNISYQSPTTEEKNTLTGIETTGSPAPVVHLNDERGALLIDFEYGMGRVSILTDPYMVSNGGINLGDNLQLAVNMLTAGGGLIAFDEYHQGKGLTQNSIAGYFAGTPVLLLAGQAGLVVLLMLWTRGRRFGRPLPLPQVDRRSSLEFVASMAELQQRARAFDLAIENIYTRTRRVLARYAGVNYNSSRTEIASLIAARGTIDANRLETLMRRCEDVINGQPCS
ncbi:MAG TPA: DUF4350 domain-containing protein, partial [Pyrinomonadaceae bacterium]|nr:DUF4350 domain-containing protein [Pyrinomonadaceae bacterium]